MLSSFQYTLFHLIFNVWVFCVHVCLQQHNCLVYMEAKRRQQISLDLELQIIVSCRMGAGY